MTETTETWTAYVLSCPWDHPVREVLAALRIAESIGIEVPASLADAMPHVLALAALANQEPKEGSFNV